MSHNPKKAFSPFSYIPGEVDGFTIKRVFEVLKNIFKYLGFRDLRQLRLVSRAWNNAVCNGTIFGDLCAVVLRGDPDAVLTILNLAEHKFWKDLRFITPQLDNSTQIQASFWITMGSQIRSLSLVSHSLSPVEFLSVLSACTNMKSLTLSCKNIYGCHAWRNHEGKVSHHRMTHAVRLVENVRCLRQKNFLAGLTHVKILDSNLLPQAVLRDLLVLARRVESLQLYDCSVTSIPLWDFGDILRFAAEYPKVLKRLELTGSNIYPEYIGALANVPDLRLASLHLRYAKLTDVCLLSLFKKQTHLVEIDLSYTQCSQRVFLHLQCSFEKLKRLVLRGYSSNITSFGFLSRMPKLEELDISATFSSSMNWELLINGLLPLRLKKLKSLNLSFNLGLGVSPRTRLFTSLMSTFSHITCINLSQNNFLKDVFVHDVWRHLKHLRVVFLEYLCGLSTEGITGIRHSQMENLLANGTIDKIDPCLLRRQNSNGSYIGLCPKITVLSLAYNTRLNDFVIPFGITDLKGLQKLKLTGCTQISQQYFVELITYCPGLEYLDLTGTQIPLEWANWAKRENPYIRRIICTNTSTNPHSYGDAQVVKEESDEEWSSEDEELNILFKKGYGNGDAGPGLESYPTSSSNGDLHSHHRTHQFMYPTAKPAWKNY